MNLMNSSSFLKRILRLAIQFVGGLVAVLNSPTYFGLLRTFSAFLVVYSIVIDGFMTNIVVLGTAIAVERVFSGVVTQFHCDAQVFGLKPSKF